MGFSCINHIAIGVPPWLWKPPNSNVDSLSWHVQIQHQPWTGRWNFFETSHGNTVVVTETTPGCSNFGSGSVALILWSLRFLCAMLHVVGQAVIKWGDVRGFRVTLLQRSFWRLRAHHFKVLSASGLQFPWHPTLSLCGRRTWRIRSAFWMGQLWLGDFPKSQLTHLGFWQQGVRRGAFSEDAAEQFSSLQTCFLASVWKGSTGTGWKATLAISGNTT